jgi:hypothetical protein
MKKQETIKVRKNLGLSVGVDGKYFFIWHIGKYRFIVPCNIHLAKVIL